MSNIKKLCLYQCKIRNIILLFDNLTCLNQLKTLSIKRFNFKDEILNILTKNLSMLNCLNELEFECIIF